MRRPLTAAKRPHGGRRWPRSGGREWWWGDSNRTECKCSTGYHTGFNWVVTYRARKNTVPFSRRIWIETCLGVFESQKKNTQVNRDVSKWLFLSGCSPKFADPAVACCSRASQWLLSKREKSAAPRHEKAPPFSAKLVFRANQSPSFFEIGF